MWVSMFKRHASGEEVGRRLLPALRRVLTTCNLKVSDSRCERQQNDNHTRASKPPTNHCTLPQPSFDTPSTLCACMDTPFSAGSFPAHAGEAADPGSQARHGRFSLDYLKQCCKIHPNTNASANPEPLPRNQKRHARSRVGGTYD